MIKQPWLAFVSLGLLAFVIYFVCERFTFLSRAEKAQATITNISAYNDRCGGGRRRRSSPCTKYQADSKFTTQQHEVMNFGFGAGSCSGHGRDKSCANYRVGQVVSVVYDPKSPSRAYLDTLWGVWGGGLVALIAQVITFFSSLFEPKRRGIRI